MFKFVEDKRFFYVCAALSIVVTVLSANLLAYNVLTVFINTLTILFLLAMIVFNNVEHKELMKVLTASFLQMIILKNVSEYNSIVTIVSDSVTGIHRYFNINIVSFRGITLLVTTLLLLILFVNHFVINFSGKASKVAININKIVIVLYIIHMIVYKCVIASRVLASMPLFNSMTPKAQMALVLDGIPTLIYALAVVAMEAFVNKEREKKM